MIGYDYKSSLLLRYKSKGLLIDTNLFILYVVGKFDLNYIQNFKRTAKYTKEDYNLLEYISNFFDVIVSLPNVLTEVSNLLNQVDAGRRAAVFKTFFDRILFVNETYVTSEKAAAEKYFKELGLTDSAIISAAKDQYLVLTDDFRLFSILSHHRIDAINFNHLRQL